jgi:amino acid adenylation domain-containing protein
MDSSPLAVLTKVPYAGSELKAIATSWAPPRPDELRLRASVLAVHELRAGRAPVVRVLGETSETLRFPERLDMTFAELVQACTPSVSGEDATWMVAREETTAERQDTRLLWSDAGFSASRAVAHDEFRWIVRRLDEIVRQVRARPSLRLSQLDVLPSDERAAVLAHTRGHRVPLTDGSVLGLFLAIAKKQPTRLAVGETNRRWTYEEIARRARAYATELVRAGVGEDDIVAICLPRGGDTVAAILGVFWCGAAYAFLDPEYPAMRRQLMLDDVKAKALLAEPGVDWEGATPARIAPSEVGDGSDWRTSKPAVGRLAYVIYTSGSTGKPKGVCVPHKGIAKELEGMRRAVELDEDDVFVALASPSFDTSICELLLPLALGAQTHIIPPHDILDGQRLLAHFDRVRPTVALLLRVVADSLLAAGWKGDPDLRVWFGGEAARLDLSRRVASMTRALYNCYGPTEASITVTVHRFLPTDREPVPIGRPIANVDVYVLDEERRLVPFGFVGELYVGGAGVSDGYLGQPELTAERYPTIDIDGTKVRVYKTGDLVRMRASGELDFVGRKDEQVKLRGYRIELGEVAATLRAAPGVKDALAVAHGDELVAYLIVDNHDVTARDFSTLRGLMAERLPRFMLPHRYVVVDKWPLNSNLKVDVAKLPAPYPVAIATTDPAPAAPRVIEAPHPSPAAKPSVDPPAKTKDPAVPAPLLDTATLRAVAKTALGLPELGDDDDFGDFGATSLNLVRLANALRGRGLKVSVSELYEHSTLSSLFALFGVAPSAEKAPLGAPPAAPSQRISAPSPALPSAAASAPAGATSLGAPAVAPGVPPEVAAGERVRVAGPERSYPLSSPLAYLLLRASLENPAARAAIGALSWSFARAPSTERLRAAWVAVVRDTPVLRARFDLGDREARAIIATDVDPHFACWDETQMFEAGYQARVRTLERTRKAAGLDFADAPHHHLDLVLGPKDQATVLFSYAVALLDLETVNLVIQDLWRRYEGSGSHAVPAADVDRSPFGEPEVASPEAAALFREMLDGITKPTRIPRNATNASMLGIANGVLRLAYYWHTARELFRQPHAKKLLDAAGGARKDAPPKPSLAGFFGLLGALTCGRPDDEAAFAREPLRQLVHSRVRELRVSEQSLFISTLGILLSRWTRSLRVIIRVLVSNRDEGDGGGRTTRDLPICVRVEPTDSIRDVVRWTNGWIGRLLLVPNASRDAVLEALPFGEPVTDALYISGDPPEVTPPASMAPVAVRTEETVDVLFALSVAWGISEFRFMWDATRIQSTTARRRLDEYMRLLQSLATLPPQTLMRELPP